MRAPVEVLEVRRKGSVDDGAAAAIVPPMKDLRDERLRKDRQQLASALDDLECGRLTGVSEPDRKTIQEMLTLRIAEIDRVLCGPTVTRIDGDNS